MLSILLSVTECIQVTESKQIILNPSQCLHYTAVLHSGHWTLGTEH